MIPVEVLDKIDHVVVHGYSDKLCPDGVASALILRDAIPGAQIQFVAHGPPLEALEARPHMLFCDIAPPVKRVDEFLAVGAVVLDHHKSAKDLVALFEKADRGAFADEKDDPGVSGALLAYRKVWRPLAFRGAQRPPNHQFEGRGDDMVASFAKTVGVRDTYQRKSSLWDASCRLSAALAFWPFDRWPLDLFAETRYSEPFQAMLDVGEVLVEKKNAEVLSMWKRRYVTTVLGDRDDLDVVVIPTRETTDAAELLSSNEGLLVGFDYEAGDSPHSIPVLSLSLRSRERKDDKEGYAVRFDCSALAKRHGGGGHTGAAGFRISTQRDPYAMIDGLLRDYAAAEGNRIYEKRNL